MLPARFSQKKIELFIYYIIKEAITIICDNLFYY